MRYSLWLIQFQFFKKEKFGFDYVEGQNNRKTSLAEASSCLSHKTQKSDALIFSSWGSQEAINRVTYGLRAQGKECGSRSAQLNWQIPTKYVHIKTRDHTGGSIQK